jgi:hypothetical protein
VWSVQKRIKTFSEAKMSITLRERLGPVGAVIVTVVYFGCA